MEKKQPSYRTSAIWIAALFLLFAEPSSCLASGGLHEAADHVGRILPVWTVIPFAGILLSIALCPRFVPRFWHNHFGKVSAFWALAFALPFLVFDVRVAAYSILHITISTTSPSSFSSGGCSPSPVASSCRAPSGERPW
jgi:hypothetical protein